MLHSLYLLIVFMALTCDENHVALLGQHTCCTDGFATVNDAQHLLHLLLVETCQHIVDDILGLLESWIIRCNDNFVALLYCLLSHQWALALIAVTASTTNSDDFSLAVKHLVDGVKNILKCIGGVGVVNDSGITLRRVDKLCIVPP